MVKRVSSESTFCVLRILGWIIQAVPCRSSTNKQDEVFVLSLACSLVQKIHHDDSTIRPYLEKQPQATLTSLSMNIAKPHRGLYQWHRKPSKTGLHFGKPGFHMFLAHQNQLFMGYLRQFPIPGVACRRVPRAAATNSWAVRWRSWRHLFTLFGFVIICFYFSDKNEKKLKNLRFLSDFYLIITYHFFEVALWSRPVYLMILIWSEFQEICEVFLNAFSVGWIFLCGDGTIMLWKW